MAYRFLVLHNSTEVGNERKEVCIFTVIEGAGVRKIENVIALNRFSY